MWGFTNSGGSDLINAFAIITVTYPAGSICTCTNGTVTLTAGSTSGIWAFGVPEGGDWTVTINDGATGETAFKDVSDVGQHDVIAVSLTYKVPVVVDGILQSPFTLNNWTQQSGYIQAHANAGATVMAVLMPITRVSNNYLKFKIKPSGGTTATYHFGLRPNTTIDINFSAFVTGNFGNLAEFEGYVDLTGLDRNQDYYIACRIKAGAQSQCNFMLYDLEFTNEVTT